MLKVLDFPTEASDTLPSVLDRIKSDRASYDRFTSAVKKYNEGCDMDHAEAINEMDMIAEHAGVNKYSCYMLHFLSLCGFFSRITAIF